MLIHRHVGLQEVVLSSVRGENFKVCHISPEVVKSAGRLSFKRETGVNLKSYHINALVCK